MLILHLLPERQPPLFFKKEKAQPLREKNPSQQAAHLNVPHNKPGIPQSHKMKGCCECFWRCREGQSQVTQEREKEEFPDQMKGEAGMEGRELVTDEQGR